MQWGKKMKQSHRLVQLFSLNLVMLYCKGLLRNAASKCTRKATVLGHKRKRALFFGENIPETQVLLLVLLPPDSVCRGLLYRFFMSGEIKTTFISGTKLAETVRSRSCVTFTWWGTCLIRMKSLSRRHRKTRAKIVKNAGGTSSWCQNFGDIRRITLNW